MFTAMQGNKVPVGHSNLVNISSDSFQEWGLGLPPPPSLPRFSRTMSLFLRFRKGSCEALCLTDQELL